MTNPKSTLADLLRQADELAEKIKLAKAAELESCRTDAMALITDRGFTLAEIFPEGTAIGTGRRARKTLESSVDGRSTVPPKYRNPDNLTETWTGRGRQPKWVAAKLTEGISLETLLIANG